MGACDNSSSGHFTGAARCYMHGCTKRCIKPETQHLRYAGLRPGKRLRRSLYSAAFCMPASSHMTHLPGLWHLYWQTALAMRPCWPQSCLSFSTRSSGIQALAHAADSAPDCNVSFPILLYQSLPAHDIKFTPFSCQAEMLKIWVDDNAPYRAVLAELLVDSVQKFLPCKVIRHRDNTRALE